MKNRIKIGDIIEIQTGKGAVYAQFYHYHSAPPNFGALLRILPGFFSQRPAVLEKLAGEKEIFSTFFPLQAAVNRGLVKIVGNGTVPLHARQFPLFRTGFTNPNTGKVEQWRLWDGHKEWIVGKLTDAQLDLPILSIPSYPTLVEEIEEGWTPRREEEFIEKARAKLAQTGEVSDGPKVVEEIRHYLIFKRQDRAEKAAARIRALNLQAGLTDLGESWGVNVLQPEASDGVDEKLAERLEKIASAEGGIYDGTQVKLGSELDPYF